MRIFQSDVLLTRSVFLLPSVDWTIMEDNMIEQEMRILYDLIDLMRMIRINLHSEFSEHKLVYFELRPFGFYLASARNHLALG